jgi:adenosylmethionine-8-amino-7-oxononanoate aminotransferase
MSYHGNTVSTLSLAYHPTRRAPYAAIMDSDHFHHVSPAYAARFKQDGETEEQYVERLKAELEAKFEELGGENVIACQYFITFFLRTVIDLIRHAVVAETVVGATTGVVPAPKGYFKAASEVCKKYGALFILDEVRRPIDEKSKS